MHLPLWPPSNSVPSVTKNRVWKTRFCGCATRKTRKQNGEIARESARMIANGKHTNMRKGEVACMPNGGTSAIGAKIALPEFSADGADGRGLCGSPSALIRVISGQISSSVPSAASCKTDSGLVAAPPRCAHPWLKCRWLGKFCRKRCSGPEKRAAVGFSHRRSISTTAPTTRAPLMRRRERRKPRRAPASHRG